jgi:hypothetical protein
MDPSLRFQDFDSFTHVSQQMFDAQKSLHAVRKIPIIRFTITGRHKRCQQNIRNYYLSTGFDKGRRKAALLLGFEASAGKISNDLDKGRDNEGRTRRAEEHTCQDP